MSWTLTITGDCQDPEHGPACLVVPIRDYVHSHRKACDTVEQLVCEEFHDTYPAHVICDMCWTEDVK